MRYRLRTLMLLLAVVGVALAWIAGQYRIVSHRKSVARQLENRGDLVVWEDSVLNEPVILIVRGDKSRRVNTVRRWLGDENVDAILIINASEDNRTPIEAFPEADVYLHDLGAAHVPFHDPRRAVADHLPIN